LYQQTGKSAKTRSTTADAPQSSQPKRKGPKSTKSQAKRRRTTTPPPPPRSLIPIEASPSSPEAQTQQAPSPPHPQIEPQPEEPQPEEPQPEEISADVHEQTTDPASLIIASVVSSIQTSTAPPQGNVLSMKLLPIDLFFHFIIIFINLSADIVSSAIPSDQPVVPSASTSHRREIALKQVSYLIIILYFTNISSSINPSPFQEQDSPDSQFSFAIEISEDEGEEASSSQAIGISLAEIRAKLEDLSALLHQDTTQLVDDSDPANALFKALRGQIPVDAEEILFKAAHLESRELQYQKATQRLGDRAAHAQLSEEVMKVKHLADEKHKSIGILKSSGDTLKLKISDLSAKREVLLAELKQVEEALSQAQQEESQLPEIIKTLEQERNAQARKALQMKMKLKPMEGSADEDIKEIEEADQIRLRAISAIQALLNA